MPGVRVFVTWNPDKADRWKGGGTDSQLSEYSSPPRFESIARRAAALSGTWGVFTLLVVTRDVNLRRSYKVPPGSSIPNVSHLLSYKLLAWILVSRIVFSSLLLIHTTSLSNT